MPDRNARVWTGSEWENISAPIGVPNAIAAFQAAAPSSPVTGQLWVDQDDNRIYVWNGSSWAGATEDLSAYAPKASPIFTGTSTISGGDLHFSDGTTREGRILSSGDTFYVQAGTNASDTTAKLNISRWATGNTNISQFNLYADTTSIFGDTIISKSDASTTLTIRNTSSTTSRYPQLQIVNYNNTGSGFPALEFFNARGSQASPTASQSGDTLGGITGWAWDGTSFNDVARIYFIAENNSTASDSRGFITFNTQTGTTISERMRINSSGNIGINTTNPGGRLSVQVDTNKDIVSGITTTPAITYRNGSGAWFHAGKHTSSDYFEISHGNTPSTNPILVANSSSNVGIGVTNPSNRLEVATSSGDSVILSTGPSTSAGYVAANGNGRSGLTGAVNLISYSSGVAELTNRSNAALIFGTNNTERMRITSAGDIGIGVSPASNMVNILGKGLEVTRNSAISYIDIISNGVGGYLPSMLSLIRRSDTGGATPNSTNLGEIRFAGLDTNSSYALGASIVAVAGVNAAGGIPTDLIFNTASSGAQALERMRINASGRVGIGTSNPQEVFSITGSSGTNPAMVFEHTSQASYKLGVDGQVFKIAAMDNGFGGHTGSFVNNDTQVISMTTTGNVGIGTTTPVGRLQVTAADDARMFMLSGTTKGIRFGTSSNNSIIEAVDTTGIASYQPLAVGGSYVAFTIGGAERMRIDSSGNVGIGITNPNVKLQVLGSVAATASASGYATLDAGNSTNTGYVSFFNSSATRMGYLGYAANAANGNMNLFTDTTNGIAFGTNSITRMTIDSTGRIKIPAGGIVEAPVSTNAQTGTAYTLVLTDAGKVIEMNNAAANTLTVPTDASVNFPIGTVIDIFQTGAGQTTVGGAGVTINARPGLKLSGQWATATLIKRAANTWLLTGSLSA